MRLALAAVLLLAAALPAGAVRPTESARQDSRRFGLDKLERKARRLPRQDVKDLFTRFNATHEGRWKLRFNPRSGLPEALVEGRTAPRGGAPETAARQFLREQQGLLGVNPDDLSVEKETKGDGHRHVLYRQTYRGVPVEFAHVKVHLSEDGSVIGYHSNYEADLNVNLRPRISAAEAARAAASDARGSADGVASLVILPLESTGRAHLAWKVKVKGPQAAWRYYIDADTGQTLFRYNNLRFVCAVEGTMLGTVYDIDPSSTPAAVRPLDNMWVYIATGTTRALTGGDAVKGHGYYCSPAPYTGKISAAYQGQFVNVGSFRGNSAHYDNGSGVWQTLSSPVSSDHPYQNSASQTSQINLAIAAPTAARFLPVFNTFKVGEFSGADASDTAGGGIVDDDELTISNELGERVGAYVGNRGSFHGQAVAGKLMNLTLVSNESGQQDGYDVSLSSYLTLTAPTVNGSAASSSHTWVTSDAPINLHSELNMFYHLNRMHDYFFGDVDKSSAAPISTPVVAMAHVGPNVVNAFYNPDYDNLMFGDVDVTSPQDGFTDDATVTHHEYVHYLVEKIWSIQNFGQSGAISEGIADYFSASSLNDPSIGAFVLSSLGGTGSLRDLDCTLPGITCKVLNDTSWHGEIHDDSIFLSQALWDIRRDRIAALGYTQGGSCADGLVFQALLFFPESFGEVLDAMRGVDAQGLVAACGGASTAQAAINSAFAAHGLILGAGDVYERNDGFEVATDVSTRPTVSATIFPTGDTDFFSFGAGAGLVKIVMNLPPFGGYYKAYQLKLFDRAHHEVARAAPTLDGTNTVDGFCETLDCNTSEADVTLQYNNPTGGQLYLQVVGGESLDGSASGVESTTPYALDFTYPKAGALAGGIVTAAFDNDVISFNADVSTFVTNQDWRFSSAQLRDHVFNPLSNTRVNLPAQVGDFLLFQSSGNANGHITGSVKLAPGFAARYPSAGTVYLELFGYNVHGSTDSLGMSNAINLTASLAELTAYNNVFNPARGQKATVKYATLTAGRVVLKLFTVTGTYVATLLDADMPAGRGTLDWDGRNSLGSVVASGIYLLRIDAPGVHKTQKIAIIK